MTRPPGPFEDDSIDGSLRPLLWRLRARLVTPPVEQRGDADMDRLVAAARELAHTAPSPGASSRPGVAAGSSTPAFPLSGDELAVRRRRGIPQLGRIAAAVVVVVATASGVAGARDGTVTLNALLGRDSSPTAQTASEPLPDTGSAGTESGEDEDTTGDGEGDQGQDATDPDMTAPDPTPEDSDATDSVDQNAADDPDDAADDVQDAPARSDTPNSSGGESDTDGSEGTSGGDSPSDEPSSEEPSTDAPSTGDQVIAAPEDVDGFGGPAPRDCETLEDCLPEGETEPPVADEVAADDEPSDETPSEDEADDASDDADGDSGDDGDDLAARRFQPSNDEPSTS